MYALTGARLTIRAFALFRRHAQTEIIFRIGAIRPSQLRFFALLNIWVLLNFVPASIFNSWMHSLAHYADQRSKYAKKLG
ncbi:hypothetical protein K469DRAFT_706230 [Zopfia rhizophila CBS 207.26]|uniref:Uncharacterized protein n=1 Tax=Zopfia rhizophila CBS 207.26 TaxID=1314779 RepID=A0A6A6EUT5_9PEZI|nr:hypothetical protein K469DRAFT_706230 [Zopfia rhizophila CBS 207.26]